MEVQRVEGGALTPDSPGRSATGQRFPLPRLCEGRRSAGLPDPGEGDGGGEMGGGVWQYSPRRPELMLFLPQQVT